MKLMTGLWDIYRCKEDGCGCIFAILKGTYSDAEGCEVCPNCDVINTELIGSESIG